MDRLSPSIGASLYKKNMEGFSKVQKGERAPFSNGSNSSYGSPELLGAQSSKVIPETSRMDVLKDVYGEKRLKQLGLVECATCASRTYVDGSDDPGVSFKSPGKISPEASFAMVSSHEQEHVSNEQASALAEDREVVAQSVQIFMSVCPECGKAYASGGVTKTTTAGKSAYSENKTPTSGSLIDAKV